MLLLPCFFRSFLEGKAGHRLCRRRQQERRSATIPEHNLGRTAPRHPTWSAAAASGPGAQGGPFASRRDCERVPELPCRGGSPLSTQVTARRSGGSRRTIGWPAATSSASAKSAQRSSEASRRQAAHPRKGLPRGGAPVIQSLPCYEFICKFCGSGGKSEVTPNHCTGALYFTRSRTHWRGMSRVFHLFL